MIYRTFGRSGLKVSALGMGTGGADALGAKSGRSETEMQNLLKFAYDNGITLFDTSPGYGDGRSERILGKAVQDIGRDNVVVSTKMAVAGGMPGQPLTVMKPEEIGPALDESLQRLQMDYVDVLLTSVADAPEHFDTVINDLIPELLKLKEQGKIRCLGSSEQTRSDGSHKWLQRVLATGKLDVAMTGQNMLNQSARHTVFPICKEKNIGVMNVFTVRNLFWNLPYLEEVIADLKKRGVIPEDAVPDKNPLGWVLDYEGVDSMVEAGYRYAAYTDPVTSVMCGTIDKSELQEDARLIEKGPLPQELLDRLHSIFGHIDEPLGN